MARDKVKTELANTVRESIKRVAQGMPYALQDLNVKDVEVTQVTELETQVKVVYGNGQPRYFIVKVSEKA